MFWEIIITERKETHSLIESLLFNVPRLTYYYLYNSRSLLMYFDLKICQTEISQT